MTAPLVTSADPVLYIVNYLRVLLPDRLPGYTVGTRVAPGVTPSRFVRVEVVGGDDVQRVKDRPLIRFQVWGPGGTNDASERMRAANILSAHLRRDLRAKSASYPVSLPDPVDASRELTQFLRTTLIDPVES